MNSSQNETSPKGLNTNTTDQTLLNADLYIPDLPELGLRNSKTIDIDSRNIPKNKTQA